MYVVVMTLLYCRERSPRHTDTIAPSFSVTWHSRGANGLPQMRSAVAFVWRLRARV